LDKKINLLEEFVNNVNILNLNNMLESSELSNYPNWHETFNKSNKKLITDEEIEKLDGNVENNWKWNEDKNLLKFFDYVDKNFKIEIRKEIYEKFHLNSKIHNRQIQIQIFLKYRNVIKNLEFMDMSWIHLDYYYISFEALVLIFDSIEKDFNFNSEILNYFLFHYPHKIVFNITTPPCPWPSPILRVFQSKNPKIYVFDKDFFYEIQKDNDRNPRSHFE